VGDWNLSWSDVTQDIGHRALMKQYNYFALYFIIDICYSKIKWVVLNICSYRQYTFWLSWLNKKVHIFPKSGVHNFSKKYRNLSKF
jgi:hypothetical protein